MRLERIYQNVGTKDQRVVAVRILHGGSRQRFTPHLLGQAEKEGWLKREGDRVIIQTENRKVVYRTLRIPGYYCCTCGAPLPGAEEAKMHVSQHPAVAPVQTWWQRFLGQPAPAPVIPDPQNPAGYRQDNFYECVRED